ncbi:MAG: Gfo/Idh/MocA family oxidoreductase [Melioribacteraceae bacterium]|nr:Gfo/Idh/MocA family oxidoreductase [Melioribacteraceae bacterium]MCF8353805.1 Gfo/Idh/MocA family oxidoreductase [Melioribacteraceae bacterium]MCF8393641.1 Gfo/Idh/MocA family oxidoreductase [Melioribacteraceae bacterium]MCF8419451.1 Gfo/Idh/MocA family oxidoreductase [Melioribacteraceae bacterium]
METVGVGMIGAGSMGMVIAEKLAELNPRIKINSIYDPDQRSIDNALNILPPPVTVHDDYKSILNSPHTDWVMISSWNCYHKEQVIASFEAGKNVFCQKPLAVNLEECKEIYESHKKHNSLFNIGFTLRYSPHYRKIKELIDDGAIGYIVSMEFNETLDFNHGGYIMGDWRRLQKYAGTHLLEKCCHDIDLANWIINSRAKRAASFGGLNFFIPENEHHIDRIGKDQNGKPAYSTWFGLINENPFTSEKDIVDNQIAILEYENGVRASFHTNCNAGIPERRMYILGSEGAIRADVLTGIIELKRIGFDTKIIDKSTGASGGHGDGDDVLARELADSMINNSVPAVGIEAGLLSSVTSFAIDEAMNTGTVIDIEKYWSHIFDD